MNNVLQSIILLVIGITFIGILGTMGSDIVSGAKQDSDSLNYRQSVVPARAMVLETKTEATDRIGKQMAGSLVFWIPKNIEKVRIKCKDNYLDFDLDLDDSETQKDLSSIKEHGFVHIEQGARLTSVGNENRLDISFNMKTADADCEINSYSVPEAYQVIDLTTNTVYSLNREDYDKNTLEKVYVELPIITP